MVRTQWPVFNRRLMKHYKMPRGFTIALYHDDGRKARTNMEPERERVNDQHLSALGNEERVTAFLAAAKSLFPAGSKVLGLKWKLLDMRGKPVTNGTSLGKVREMEGEPSESEKEQAEMEALRIEELQREAAGHIAQMEELEEDPHTTVPQACVDALVDRYGLAVLHEALAKHLKPKRGGR